MARPHLTMYELLDRLAAVNLGISVIEQREREQALETIRALMKEHGLTLQQVERHNGRKAK